MKRAGGSGSVGSTLRDGAELDLDALVVASVGKHEARLLRKAMWAFYRSRKALKFTAVLFEAG